MALSEWTHVLSTLTSLSSVQECILWLRVLLNVLEYECRSHLFSSMQVSRTIKTICRIYFFVVCHSEQMVLLTQNQIRTWRVKNYLTRILAFHEFWKTKLQNFLAGVYSQLAFSMYTTPAVILQELIMHYFPAWFSTGSADWLYINKG